MRYLPVNAQNFVPEHTYKLHVFREDLHSGEVLPAWADPFNPTLPNMLAVIIRCGKLLLCLCVDEYSCRDHYPRVGELDDRTYTSLKQLPDFLDELQESHPAALAACMAFSTR